MTVSREEKALASGAFALSLGLLWKPLNDFLTPLLGSDATFPVAFGACFLGALGLLFLLDG